MADELVAPPAFSTLAEHLFEHIDPEAPPTESQILRRTDDELREVFEIPRTAREIHNGRRRRVALQFPDSMLGDAPRVSELLKDELARLCLVPEESGETIPSAGEPKIYILADTSYSGCCVDEIAAEHVDADIIVHIGRSCLSPTSRLPVIYVFTRHQLDESAVAAAFEKQFAEKDAKVVLVADVTFQDHVPAVFLNLASRGYGALLSTQVVHNPMGSIPNRSVVNSAGDVLDLKDSGVDLAEYAIFHISAPPTALLLALSSRVKAFHIYPTPALATAGSLPQTASTPSTRALLGRRYAKVLTLATAGIIGILVYTLSVSNYLSSVDTVRKRIAAAGKKSYTVVVGKLNPAKLANFAEVDGWVVIGCWESGLVEDDTGFYRPVVTPFELEVALMPDEERVWGDRWWGGIEGVGEASSSVGMDKAMATLGSAEPERQTRDAQDGDINEDEDEPPEFDLRTGKLVSRSRPIRVTAGSSQQNGTAASETADQTGVLAIRAKSELATVKGAVSPGAEFLRSQRTWQGLGTDFSPGEASTSVEEGRSGVARGYTVGEDESRR